MEQGTLFELRTIDERFAAWLKENPLVYELMVKLAREAKAKGKKRIGMKALFEVARWTIWLQTTGDDFKLNNTYASRLARIIEEREPDLRGIFEFRRLHT